MVLEPQVQVVPADCRVHVDRQVARAASAVRVPVEHLKPRQLQYYVVQRAGHLAGAAARARDRFPVDQDRSGLVSVLCRVRPQDLVPVEDIPGLQHDGDELSAQRDVVDPPDVRLVLVHLVVAGVSRDRAVLVKLLVRRRNRLQVRQLVRVDVSVFAHIIDHGPSVIELPDGDLRARVQDDPVIPVIPFSFVEAHALAHMAVGRRLGDVGVLLRAENRRCRGIHRRRFAVVGFPGCPFAQHIADDIVFPDDHPPEPYVQDFHVGDPAVALHEHLALLILLAEDAGIPVPDGTGIDRRGIHVKVLERRFLVNPAGYPLLGHFFIQLPDLLKLFFGQLGFRVLRGRAETEPCPQQAQTQESA